MYQFTFHTYLVVRPAPVFVRRNRVSFACLSLQSAGAGFPNYITANMTAKTSVHIFIGRLRMQVMKICLQESDRHKEWSKKHATLNLQSLEILKCSNTIAST